tara:strand:+ start:80743 stop:81150 length:408 start_codon:yes stop_codon:yes gene_type:complete
MSKTKKLLAAAAIATPIAMGLTAIQIEGELFTLGNMLSNIATAGLFLGAGAATIGLGVGALYLGFKTAVALKNKSVETASSGCQVTREIASTAGDKLSSAFTSARSYLPSWPKRGAQAPPVAELDEPRADVRSSL